MKSETSREKTPMQLLEEGLPQFEQFIESRESYIKALEQTIQVLKQENASANSNHLTITSSVDELVAMQRFSNTISTALEPEQIVSALIDLTRQVIPIIESNIFLFEGKTNKALALSSRGSARLQQEADVRSRQASQTGLSARRRRWSFPIWSRWYPRSAAGILSLCPSSSGDGDRHLPYSHREASAGILQPGFAAPVRSGKPGRSRRRELAYVQATAQSKRRTQGLSGANGTGSQDGCYRRTCCRGGP